MLCPPVPAVVLLVARPAATRAQAMRQAAVSPSTRHVPPSAFCAAEFAVVSRTQNAFT